MDIYMVSGDSLDHRNIYEPWQQCRLCTSAWAPVIVVLTMDINTVFSWSRTKDTIMALLGSPGHKRQHGSSIDH